MPLKLQNLYALSLLVLLTALIALLPAQAAQAAAQGTRASAGLAKYSAPATENEARQVLAAYIKEKTTFMAKISRELEAAGFKREQRAGSEIDQAAQYCWLVSKNPRRLTEARKNLLDAERMPAARMKALDSQHTRLIAGVLDNAYPPAGQTRRNRGNQPGDGPGGPGGEQELWKTAATRALAEREISVFLDFLYPLLPEKEWQNSYYSNIPPFAALLLPYANDPAVMRAVPAIAAGSPKLEKVADELAEKRKQNPGGFRQTLLYYADQAIFSSSYAALRTEGITLPVEQFNPDLAKHLKTLGNSEVSGRSEQAGDHPLGLDEGERANGLVVEKVQGEAMRALVKKLEAEHSAFIMERSCLVAFMGGDMDTAADRASAFPLHANVPQLQVKPLVSLKPASAAFILYTAERMEEVSRMKDARLLFAVAGSDAEKAGRALAENLGWLSVVFSGREAYKRGQADVIADLVGQRGGEDAGKAYLTDSNIRGLRFARPWTLPFFVTLAERAGPEQLEALFGPVDKVLITLGEPDSCYVLSIKDRGKNTAPGRLGVTPPLALPDDFLSELSQREVNLMRLLVENYYAVRQITPDIYASWLQKMDALLDQYAVVSLEQRCSLQLLLAYSLETKSTEDFFAMAQKLLADKNGRLVDKLNWLLER